ncbi:MAG: hypothetical protein AAGC78_10020 [Cellvibrio sp.]|uniref:hypothetical protein n=1 Tax=Cellvibrio sp. TaxID=1965322 RepID=UPI00319F745F
MNPSSLFSIAALKKALAILPLIGLLTACGSDNDDIKVDPNTKMLHIDFNDSITGWKAGFADYPEGEEEFYELGSGQTSLPAPLTTTRKGYKITGNNHSDDLFMFITKQVDGLEPNTRYSFRFKVTFGTNAPNNCMGIGGSPGNSVWIKVGATKNEPKTVNDGTGFLLLNWDKGNQATGGSDAIIAGDFANSQECEASNSIPYLKKTLITEKDSYTSVTDEKGSVWLLLGTDSGFEGPTTIYFMELEVAATKL